MVEGSECGRVGSESWERKGVVIAWEHDDMVPGGGFSFIVLPPRNIWRGFSCVDIGS